MQRKCGIDEQGKQRKVEVAKRGKHWLIASVDGKVNLIMRHVRKPAEVAVVLKKVREAAELGDLDTLIEQQAQFGRRIAQKSTWQVKWNTRVVQARS